MTKQSKNAAYLSSTYRRISSSGTGGWYIILLFILRTWKIHDSLTFAVVYVVHISASACFDAKVAPPFLNGVCSYWRHPGLFQTLLFLQKGNWNENCLITCHVRKENATGSRHGAIRLGTMKMLNQWRLTSIECNDLDMGDLIWEASAADGDPFFPAV